MSTDWTRQREATATEPDRIEARSGPTSESAEESARVEPRLDRQVITLRDEVAALRVELSDLRHDVSETLGSAGAPTSVLAHLRAGLSRIGGAQGLVRSERWILTVIVLCALGLRLAWLASVPPNVTADEADNLRVVYSIQETGEPRFFGLDWKPAPAFSMQIANIFVQRFENDVFGLRLPSALLSALALIPFFALARRLVRPPAAIVAVTLLATSRWYLHFSRSGWENVHVAFYALLAVWSVTVALERRQLRWFVLGGIASALGLYGYFSGRLILVAFLVYAPFAIWFNWRRPRVALLGFPLLAFTALLLFLPQLATIGEHWEYFNRRSDAVYALNAPRPYLGETSDWGILRVQLERTLSAFLLLKGDLFENERYGPSGQPLYDTTTGLLFVIGLWLSRHHLRATALWWCFLFVPLLGTQVLSTGTPDGARAIIVTPFIYLFVALTVDRLFSSALVQRETLLRVVLIVALLLVMVENVRSYATWIRSPVAAEARYPAVEYEDFDVWEASVRCALRPDRCLPAQDPEHNGIVRTVPNARDTGAISRFTI